MKILVAIIVAAFTCLLIRPVQASTHFQIDSDKPHCASMTSGCDNVYFANNETLQHKIEVRVPNQPKSQAIRFSGEFTNTTFAFSGVLEIDLLIVSDTTIEGFTNFSEFQGDPTVCGAGNFEGTKAGNLLEFQFASDDLDPGCGFDQDVIFTIKGTLSDTNSSVIGSYSTDIGQQGILNVARVPTEVYMPFVHH